VLLKVLAFPFLTYSYALVSTQLGRVYVALDSTSKLPERSTDANGRFTHCYTTFSRCDQLLCDNYRPPPSLTLSCSSDSRSSDLDSSSENFANPKHLLWQAIRIFFQKRVCVSLNNLSHGMVEGAMIGNRAFGESTQILTHCPNHSLSPRRQLLRKAQEDKSKSKTN